MKSTQRAANGLSRRDFLRWSGLTGGMIALAACAAPAAPAAPPAAGESAAPASAPAAEQITISWWNQFSSATTQAVFPVVVGQFEELYPNVKVEFEISGGPPGGGEYIEVLLARIAAGNPPNTVTLWTPPSQFGAQGALAEIDDFMANAKWAKPDAFFEGPLKSCQWNGSTYGLPASAGAGSIFVNADKFAEAGVSIERDAFPKTWADLQALSAQFTRWEGDDLQQAGIVPWSAGWLKPVWSALNGGKIFDAEAGAYVVDSPQNVEWLGEWVKWLDAEYGGDVEKLNLYGDWGTAYPGGAYEQGLAAMTIDGSWACTDVELAFEWEVMPFPVGPSGSQSVTGFWPNWWAMPKGSAHPDQSFLFCEYLCTEGWITWYKAVMDTPAWKDFPADVLTQKLVDGVGAERAQEIHNFYAQQLENTAEMWNSPIEDFASDTLDAAIDEVLHKTKSPAEALAEVQAIVETKLQERLAG